MMCMLLTLTTSTIWACSCFFRDALDITDVFESELIFSGTVESITTEKIEDKASTAHFSFENKRVTLRTDRFYKGGDNEPEMTILTAAQGSACGFNFEAGQSYIVWAYQYKGKWHTTICDHTARISSKSKKQEALLRRYWKAKKKARKKWKSRKDFIRGSGMLSEGVPLGYWEHYYLKGGLKSTGDYKNGKKHGIWKYYLSPSDAYRRFYGSTGMVDDKNTIEDVVEKIVEYNNGETVREVNLWKH